jgi:hypothetical protein
MDGCIPAGDLLRQEQASPSLPKNRHTAENKRP